MRDPHSLNFEILKFEYVPPSDLNLSAPLPPPTPPYPSPIAAVSKAAKAKAKAKAAPLSTPVPRSSLKPIPTSARSSVYDFPEDGDGVMSEGEESEDE